MKDRIKLVRKALGMTQQKFAEAIGVKQNTVAQYEIGRNEPVESVQNLMHKEFSINLDWLRTGEGEMFIAPNEFSLDEFAEKNHLTDTERKILKNFMSLPAETRQAMYKIFEDI